METNYRPNFFVKLWKSIVDFRFYSIITQQSLGKAFSYLIIFSILIGVISGGLIAWRYGILMKDTVRFIQSEEMPPFELRDGEFVIDIDEPIVVEDSGMIMIVDNQQQYSYNDIVGYLQGILITEKYMIVSRIGSQPVTLNFKDLNSLSFNNNSLAGFLNDISQIVSIIILLLVIIGTLLLKLFQSLMVSIAGLIINSVLRTKMAYETLYKIGIYTLTLPSTIILLCSVFNIYLTSMMKVLIYSFLVCIYMVKVLNTIKQDMPDSLQ